MGFTTGFLGGITLTTTLLYVTLSIHERNRISQAANLQRQNIILQNLLTSDIHRITPRYGLVNDYHVDQKGLNERLKDKWNKELEDGVRKLYAVDWKRVGENVEGRVVGLWQKISGQI